MGGVISNGVGAIGERVKGDVGRVREDDEGTSERKGEDELSESEEREGCCRENEKSCSRGMSMAVGNLRPNDGAEFSFSDSKSSESNRWERLEGRAELGVLGSCGSEFNNEARSVALRVKEGLDVACDDEGREDDGDGISSGP